MSFMENENNRSVSRRQFNRLSAAGMGGMLLAGQSLGGMASAADSAPAVKPEVKKEPAKKEPAKGPPPDVTAKRSFGELPEGAFTLAVMPDTQHYAENFPQHFHNQTQWIAENAEKRNIKHVLHLGDITDDNIPKQWEVARAAMGKLDGKVPYALATGNHDHGKNGKTDTRDTLLNDYFKFEQHAKQPTFGGAMEAGKLENAYHAFNAGGKEYLILALEWGPRDKSVEWANDIAAKFPAARKILITHAFVYQDDKRYDWQKYGKKQTWNPHDYPSAKFEGGTNDGEQLWQKLVSKHPGFIMTLNGHVCGDGLGRLVSSGAKEQPVHQMLVNYQVFKEGGQGYMRLIEFSPDGNTLSVKCYSPSLDLFKIDADNEFVIKLG